MNRAGTVTTVAGKGEPGFCGDGGPATSACLSNPRDVAVDDAGNLFIADSGNRRIRRVDPAGTIDTVAGNGQYDFCGDGGPAIEACLHGAFGVAVDVSGALLIADGNDHRVRKVDAAGVITTVAGNGSARFCGDGGPATSACLKGVYDVEVDGVGNLYIADSGNGVVRRVDVTGRLQRSRAVGRGTAAVTAGPPPRACFFRLALRSIPKGRSSSPSNPATSTAYVASMASRPPSRRWRRRNLCCPGASPWWVT